MAGVKLKPSMMTAPSFVDARGESGLDHIGQAVVLKLGRSDRRTFPGRRRFGEARPKMVAADDAEIARLHRPRVQLHRRKQHAAAAPAPRAWKSLSERRSAPAASQIALPFRCAAEAAKLADELAHARAGGPMVLGVRDLGRHKAGEALGAVPVRARRLDGPHFFQPDRSPPGESGPAGQRRAIPRKASDAG